MRAGTADLRVELPAEDALLEEPELLDEAGLAEAAGLLLAAADEEPVLSIMPERLQPVRTTAKAAVQNRRGFFMG